MRIALISDLHANFVALETVLADIERERVDQIISLGDVGSIGPQSTQVIRRLREISCLVVMGNTDEYLLNPEDFKPINERAQHIGEIIRWDSKQLAPSDLEFLRTFQPTVELPIAADCRLLCFHGSPQSNTDVIVAATPDDDLARILGNHRATVMAGGHTHSQMLRRFSDAMVINPGSVGLPIQRNDSGKTARPPWSEYAIIDSRGENLGVEFRRIPLDVDAVVRAARASGMPNVDIWAGEWMS